MYYIVFCSPSRFIRCVKSHNNAPVTAMLTPKTNMLPTGNSATGNSDSPEAKGKQPKKTITTYPVNETNVAMATSSGRRKKQLNTESSPTSVFVGTIGPMISHYYSDSGNHDLNFRFPISTLSVPTLYEALFLSRIQRSSHGQICFPKNGKVPSFR